MTGRVGMIRAKIPAPQRFWPKVDKNGPVVKPELGPCWLWTGATAKQTGYGRFTISRTERVFAHKFAFEAERGSVPAGLVLDHLCRNPRCVRPSHLEPVTDVENILRGTGPSALNAAKTTCVNGHPLTEENVYRFRQAHYRRRIGRACKTCRREASRRYDAKRRAS